MGSWWRLNISDPSDRPPIKRETQTGKERMRSDKKEEGDEGGGEG